MPVSSGAVTVGATPTLICAASNGVLLQNLGATAVTIGGPNVSVGQGPTLPASMTSPVAVPDVGSSNGQGGGIYGIVATGSSSVAFLAPSWGG